ncbi:class III lanthionine synthetase LanKC [Streptomyces sulphureus]|uniref:class III lanthionine synthetase LanKC n=1 Tax=Streptomyces sulphureus TaxID=47758 RepID=UPI000378145E|nr:class III lanthionine synthetase LanKC [Streptomyces sulphureus]
MDIRYPAYCAVDPRYYDSPEQAADTAQFASLISVPDGWQRRDNGRWSYYRPVDHLGADQGWKIHVSATLENATAILERTARHCFRHGLAFKFLRSRDVLFEHNSKYAPRGASGKFVALYPGDTQQLEETLKELGEELTGFEGPYILSDVRWQDGPLYVRYGSFTPQYTYTSSGIRTPAIRRPDGKLVPDSREPRFTLPDWVEVPEFLRRPTRRRVSANGGDAFPYQVRAPLHFSNGGGVYSAQRRSDGAELILKEGRPHAGLDRGGRDAVARVRSEAAALRALDSVPGVPGIHGLDTYGDHEFLAMDRVPGIPMHSWLAIHYPFTSCDPAATVSQEYHCRVRTLLARVERIITEVHARGYVFRDLQPSNIMIDDELGVSLVDFEMAMPTQESAARTLATPGFAPPGHLTGEAEDLYALAAVQLYLYFPLNSILALCPQKAGAFITEAGRRFALSEEELARMAPLCGEWTGPGPSGLAPMTKNVFPKTSGPWQPVIRDLATSLRGAATPEREDRLFPGDIGQFEHGGHGFAFGAAGVIDSLRGAGEGRLEEYVEWLLAPTYGRQSSPPGLYDGLAGVSYTLAQLGDTATAQKLLLPCLEARVRSSKLFDGLSGIGLVSLLLHQQTGEHEYLTYADCSADAVCEAVERGSLGLVDESQDGGTTTEGPSNAAEAFYGGLLYGWSGLALFLLRMYEFTGRSRYLDLAQRAVHRDLDMCEASAHGAVMLRNEGRLLPYLATGSAGIALVSDLLLDHRTDARIADMLPGLATSARTDFCIGSGLFNGRAGLVATLHRLAPRLGREVVQPYVDSGLAALDLHVLADEHGLIFPGDQNLRASTDVATGSAGVLRLASFLDGRCPEILPFLARNICDDAEAETGSTSPTGGRREHIKHRGR